MPGHSPVDFSLTSPYFSIDSTGEATRAFILGGASLTSLGEKKTNIYILAELPAVGRVGLEHMRKVSNSEIGLIMYQNCILLFTSSRYPRLNPWHQCVQGLLITITIAQKTQLIHTKTMLSIDFQSKETFFKSHSYLKYQLRNSFIPVWLNSWHLFYRVAGDRKSTLITQRT